jgi:hypothetical protein
LKILGIKIDFGGVLTTPTAPQMTDVNPNRWGGTYDPPERNDDQNDDLKAGEEVRVLSIIALEYGDLRIFRYAMFGSLISHT